MARRAQVCLGGHEVDERVALVAECARAAPLPREDRQVHLGIMYFSLKVRYFP